MMNWFFEWTEYRPWWLYQRWARFYLWSGAVWCAARSHDRFIEKRHGFDGVYCPKCDWWQNVKRVP